MLERIYNMRQEEIFTIDEILKRKLNDITLEEIQKDIEKNVGAKEIKDEISSKLDLLIENYEIKMADCLENGYKQGFKDAVNLILECLKNYSIYTRMWKY